MSKLAIVASTTGFTGAGATAVYGAYSLGTFESFEHKKDDQYDNLYIDPDKSKFHQQNGGYCFGMHGGVFDKGSDSGKISDDTANLPDVQSKDDIKFDDPSFFNQTKVCLVVNTNITTSETKGEGSNFRFVWALSRGQTGFSVYMTGTTKADNSIEFDGVAYVFENGIEGWQTVKKMNIKNQILSSSEVASQFPQKGDVLQQKNDIDNKYWSFLDDSGTKLQGESDYQYGFWKFDSIDDSFDGYERIEQGSPNLDIGGKHFFDDTKGDMLDVIKNVKGSWY